MERITDEQLKRLLQRNCNEVENNGFSHSVMCKLPMDSAYSRFEWIVWTVGVLGILILYFTGILTAATHALLPLFATMIERFENVGVHLIGIAKGNPRQIVVIGWIMMTLFGVWLYETVMAENC